MSSIPNTNSRGSEWRKWDLHIHSLYTHLENNYSNISVDDFIKEIHDKQISVVGLTNYFNFSQNDFVLKEKLEKKNIAVFLNLEIRLAYQNKEDDCCDAHIIFDPSVTKTDIDNLLTKLNVTDNGNEKIAKNLSTKEEFSRATVEFDHLLKTLEQESLGLSGRYLIGFLSRGKGNSRSSTNYEKIAKKSHFLIHSSDKVKNIEEDREFWLSKGKPLIQSSDAHKLGNIGLKFSWIKANPTFEGLRQIIFEPIERVKVQELDPDQKSSRLIIDRVEYKDSGGVLKTVYLNKNLNSVIGSRAQGKSNLLKNIAFSIDPQQCVLREIPKSSFLAFNSFKLIWGDGKENFLEETEDKERGVLFIPQGYLGGLVYEQNPRFDRFLINLFENREDFKKAISDYRQFEDANILNITSLARDLLALRSTGIAKQDKIRKLGKKEDLDADIKETEEKIKKFGKAAAISQAQLKEHEKLSSEKALKEKEVADLDQDILSFQQLKAEEVVNSDKIDSFQFSKAAVKKIREQLTKSDKAFKEEFVEEEIKSSKSAKAALESQINDLAKKIGPLQIKVNQSNALIELTSNLSKIKTAKVQIEELEKELQILRKDYVSKKNDLINKYSSFGEEYKNLKIDFGELKYSRVQLVVGFDVASFQKATEDLINFHNSTEFKKDEGKNYTEAIPFLQNPTEWDFSKQDFGKLLKELLDGILSGKLLLKSGREVEGVIMELLKNRYKIDFLQSIVSTKGTNFSEMSDGEQMLALLEFIFKFDNYNYPVILDQPEDDLDSRAISTTIVDFVKTEKIKRQIIIASHNANLVVCGDSENVIVSHKRGRGSPDFEYQWGAIEDGQISKEIVEVLEGGRDALRSRMNKLRI